MRPSGEMRGQFAPRVSTGGARENRVTAGDGGGSRSSRAAPAATAAAPSTAASTQARRSRRRRRLATGTGTPASDPPSATHCSWSLRSWAVWMRSSGSLARHADTMRPRAGGIRGAAAARDGGSACMMAPMRLAWLLPLKARAARGHLVEHAAQGPQVAARVGLPALQLLGRHVQEGAHQGPLGREAARRGQGAGQVAGGRARRHGAGQAEVHQLGSGAGQHDVARLQVPVHQALAVGRCPGPRRSGRPRAAARPPAAVPAPGARPGSRRRPAP